MTDNARITSIDNATIKDPIVKTSNVNNTYTLTLPKKAGTVALTSDITSATSSLATQSALNTVSSNVDALEDRMDGVQQAKVFDTVAAMNTWLANSANTATLLVGTNLYIRALDVPDYWWDGTQAQELETSKVNLVDAATKTGTETLTNKTITDPILKDDSTDYTLTVPTLTENTQIATKKDLIGYSTTSHNHDGVYAPASHTHSQYLTQSSLTNYATLTGTETLTNKTITNPTLKDSSTSYKLTVPTLSQNTTIATAKDLTGYSTTSHNHDSAYAAVSHNHDSAYAAKNHNHDSAYAAASHTHSTYATKTGTEELTNKTITTPIIKNPNLRDSSHVYNLTVPTLSADDVIATQTWVYTRGYITRTPLSDYVPIYGDQTIHGTKLFALSPVLGTNAICRDGGDVITLPDAAGKLVAETSSLASSTNLMKAIIDIIYPKGIVVFFYSTDNPNDKFPGTQWEILSTGKYVQTRAQATTSATGGSSTSGSTTLQLTQIPAHKHTATSTFTGTQASGSVQSRRASAANNISNYGTNSNVSFTVTEQTGDSWKSATSTTSKTHQTDVLTWTYTPQGSVSTTTSNAGGGGGHTHTIEPPYITLSAWRRKE